MAEANEQEQAAQRQRAEEGVWRPTAERAFAAWSEAAPADKDKYLLGGPALVWAESHMMTRQEEYSAAFRRFIARSVTRRNEEMAQGRVSLDERDRRRDLRIKLMFATAATLAVLHIYSGHVQTAIESFLNGPDRRRPATIARSKAPAAVAAHSEVPVPGAGQPAIVAAEPAPPVVTPPPSRPAHPAPPLARTRPGRSVFAERDRKAEQEREMRLASRSAMLAHEMVDQGETRFALHLAIEASRDSERIARAASSPVDPAVGTSALSAVYRALASATPSLAADARPMPGVVPLACGDRHVLPLTDGTLGIVDLASGTFVPVALPSHARSRPLAVDDACGILAVPGEDFTVELAPLLSGAPKPRLVLHGHTGDILAVAFTPGRRFAATASADATVGLWDVATGRQIARLGEHDMAVTGLRFDARGSRLLSWSADKTARLWSLAGPPVLIATMPHQGAVLDAAFAAGANRIITTSLDGFIRVWDPAAAAPEVELRAAKSSFTLARLSGDASLLAGATQDGGIEIWDLSSQRQIAVSPPTSEALRDLAVSSDGGWVLTTGWSGEVRLVARNASEGAVPLATASQGILVARFGADGRSVIALDQSGRMHRWPLFASHADAIAEAERRAGPCLTATERDALGLASRRPAWCPGEQAAATAPSPIFP